MPLASKVIPYNGVNKENSINIFSAERDWNRLNYKCVRVTGFIACQLAKTISVVGVILPLNNPITFNGLVIGIIFVKVYWI